MHAYVYKSLRKPDTYLYLREKDSFGLVPEGVRLPLGELVFVLVMLLLGLTASWQAWRISGLSSWSSPGALPMFAAFVMVVAGLRIAPLTVETGGTPAVSVGCATPAGFVPNVKVGSLPK